MKNNPTRLVNTFVCLLVIFISAAHLQANEPVSESAPMKALHYYLVTFKMIHDDPVHMDSPGQIETDNKELLTIIHQHFGYMGEMHQTGRIVSGGPIIEGNLITGALFIYKANSLKEIEKMTSADPFLKTETMKLERVEEFFPGIPFK